MSAAYREYGLVEAWALLNSQCIPRAERLNSKHVLYKTSVIIILRITGEECDKDKDTEKKGREEEETMWNRQKKKSSYEERHREEKIKSDK